MLKGAARIEFTDRVLELRPGDFINIAAHQRQKKFGRSTSGYLCLIDGGHPHRLGHDSLDDALRLAALSLGRRRTSASFVWVSIATVLQLSITWMNHALG